MIERFTRFSLSVAEINRHWHRLASEEMHKFGLKGSHAMYLTTLYHFKEGLCAVKLCEMCGKDKADVSRMTTILIEKGFVYRDKLGDRQYRRPLRLTEAGKLAARQVMDRVQDAVEQAGSGLDEASRKVFYDSLEQIAENLRKMSLQ